MVKSKTWAILLICGLLLVKLAVPTSAAIIEPNKFKNGSTTDAAAPAAYMSDGQVSTGWKLASGATSGWAEINFSTAIFVHSVKINGYIQASDKLVLEYYNGNQEWVPFAGGVISGLAIEKTLGFVDQKVVTDKLRLKLSGNSAYLSSINEVKVFGQEITEVLQVLKPAKISIGGAVPNTSPNVPASFLADGNIKTSWQTTNRIEGRVVFEFANFVQVNMINLYFRETPQSSLELEGLINGAWVSLAKIRGQAVGWYRHALPETVITSKIRLIGAPYNQSVLGEVQFWGYGEYTGDQYYQISEETVINNDPLNLMFTKPVCHVGNSKADGRLKVLSYNTDVTLRANALQFKVKVQNTSFEVIDLTTVKLNYYYTNDTKRIQEIQIDDTNISRDAIIATFKEVSDNGYVDSALELGFSGGTLVPGEFVEMNVKISAHGRHYFDQSDDYSFNSKNTQYNENLKIVAKIADKLAWGIDPGSMPLPGSQGAYRLEFVFAETISESLKLDLNELQFELVPKQLGQSHTRYICVLDYEQLWEGVNFLRLQPLTRQETLVSAYIVCPEQDGVVFSEKLANGTEYLFEQKSLIEELIVYPTEIIDVPRLFVKIEGLWVEQFNSVDFNGGKRFVLGKIVEGVEIEGLTCDAQVIAKGSQVTDKAPSVKIIWPIDNETVTCGAEVVPELIGFVDDSKAEIQIDGQSLAVDGHYFNLALDGYKSDESGKTFKLEALGTDAQGRQGSAGVTVTMGEFTAVSLDQPEILIYTVEDSFTISGKVSNPRYKVAVNSQEVVAENGSFTSTVNLVEGLNIIAVECSCADNSKTFYRYVVRYTGGIALTVNQPQSDIFSASSVVKVSGTVKGLSPFKVTVNGVAATVVGNTFATEVNLVDGVNFIKVIAVDGLGQQASEQIQVKLDLVSPVIKEIATPLEGEIFNTSEVTVIAQVNDNNPLMVMANGQVATKTAEGYTAIVSLPDGKQKITVKAVDIAGNMASAAVMVEVDTTPPQEFVPNVVLGGSYKDEATINFNTIDLGSGLEKYDLYLNGILIAENAASPYQQKLADGSYLLELVASDKVGNERVGKLEFEVAGIPEVPEGFQGVYENEQIVLTWNDCPDRVATYVITRTPEFSDNTSKRILIREEAENQYIDTDIEADRAYTYLIQAVSAKDVSSDVAEPVTVITGELAVIDEAVMEKKLFDGGYLSIPAGVVAGTEEIVTEISQKPLPGNKFAAKVGNVHSFKLVDKLTQEIVERKFEKPIIATFDFSSLTIPEGYEESDLGIYWYNEIGGYWERVEYYEYNLQNRTIKVKLDHFSEYQMMASKFVSPSLDSYYGMGVSNYQGYFQNNIESVSPLSGSLSVSATDLIIPGRNGGVFAIKRTYDTAGAEQEKIIEANNTSVYQVFYKTPFDMFGNGWYLNVPWIEQNDNGKFIRLPNGQTVKIELNKKNYFEYHEGVHFVLHGTSKLVMNEGTIFEFDKEGRVIRQTDPASKNTLTYKYNGRKLVEIRDGLNPDNQSLNHVVKFTYKTITKSFSKPIEGADGNVEYEKVKYDVNFISEISSGEVAVTFDYDDNNNLIKVSDPMGRETRYTYSKRTYKSGVKATLGGDDTFKYTFWLLNQITYPTQEVSKYTYKEYDMYTEEQKYVVFVRNRVRYSGTKVVVAQHELAGKVTNYSFTMNGKIGSLLKGNFTPAYTYVLESRVKVGDLLSVNYLNQIDGTWLTDLPKDSDNYKGALPVKNITYLGNKLVEKVVCDYDVSLRAVTEQHFYREGIDKEPKYTITTKYDAWGNITQRSDTSLGVVEKFTYEKQNALDEYPKHLMIERKVENRIPKLDSDDYDVQILITTYQYQEGGLKPAAIVFNDGIKEKKTEFTYDAWWNLISQKDYSVKGLDTDEYFETRITYDKSNTFPIKKTVIGIVNANLTEAERVNITTQTEYDYQTGLKLNEIDAKGNVTSYQYDKLNRLIKVTVPTDDGGSLTKAFDFRDAENICIFTNEKQQQTLFKFDGLGRLTEVIKGSNDYQNYEGYYKDPETGIGGLRVRYEYNVYGQIEKEIDGLGNITRYKHDGMNRVTQIIYADDNAVTLSYDDTTNTTTVKNENGNEVSERKDWAGRLVEAKQKYSYTIGNSSAIYHTYFTWENKYDPLGNKLWQKDALGNVVTQKFDSLGNVLEVKLPQINVVKPGETELSPHEPLLIYEYDAAGHKIGEIGANGNLLGLSAEQREKYKTSYKYDQLGRLIKATVQATGNEARYYYDELGNKVREISLDNQGNILSEVTYTYSVRGWLLTAKAISALIDVAGKPIYRVVSYEYDELGNKTKETDPMGNSILYFYDDLNRLVRTVMPDAAKIEVAYDILGNKIKETDANGVSVSYTYDSRNRVSELRDNRGVVQTRYTYDAVGNLFEVQDAMGKVTRTEYDSLGRAVKVISNPDLAERVEVTTTYDAVGNVVATTDGRGNVYQSEYNAVGWLTKVIDPLKNEVNHQYDPAGNKVKTITPKGLKYVTEYDQLNRVVKEYESSLTTADKYVVYTYDTRGNLATSTDRRGTKFSYTYNVDNSLQRMDAINGTESYYAEYEYDLLGKVLRTSDSKGTSLASTYDKLTQRIMKVTRGFDNASYTTEYSYDKGGLITGIKYPDTSETSGWVEYAYDNLNRLSKVAGFIEEITYQDNGALTSTRYANGAYTTYTYDSNHRLASLNATVKGNDIYTAIYGYDKNSNIVSLTENVEVSKTYRYDVKNQLIQAVTIPKDQKIRETMPTPGQYALTEQDYSGQARASFFGFSEAGAKLLGLDYNSSSIGIQFDASATKIKQLQLVPDYKYKTHRIVERAINIFVSDSGDLYDAVPKNNWSFEKDGAGVVTITFNETISAAYLKVQVKYDDFNVNFTPKIDQATFLNELAKMLHVYQEGSSIKENYTYDGDGNRILEEITIVHTSKNESKYEENTNRLLENAKFTFEYDDNGNLITKRSKLTNEVWYYTYDLLNHLTRVTNREGVVLSEYNYDVTGLRVVKVAKGVKTHYIFEGTEVIYEKNITKATSKSYIYALGKHLARVDGVVGDETAKKYFYHTDHLGSIKAVTDQEGQVVFRADYFSFGKQYSKETNGDFDEAHGFTGKEYDADIDLSYFNARWYDADLGRFISEDPARDPNNPNFYSYCANNPMVYVDPTGEYFWWAVAIGAAIGGASNYSDGGSFLAGAALGAVSGAISAGIGSGVGALGLNSTMTLMLSSTISGGITSVVFGGSLSDGLKAGAISGAVAGVVRFACLKSAITNPGVISAFTGAAGAAISDGDPLEAAVTGFISGAITAGVANRQAQQRAARIMSLQEQPATNSHYDLPEECNDVILNKSYFIDAVLDDYSNRIMSNVAASFDATYEEGIGQLNVLTEAFMQTRSVNNTSPEEIIVKTARGFMAAIIPYGHSPRPFDNDNADGKMDCSELTYRAYKKAGRNIPTTAVTQYEFFKKNHLIFEDSKALPKIGDILFMATDTNRPKVVTHVAIVVSVENDGGLQYIHAPNFGRFVEESRVVHMYSGNYYPNAFVAFGRWK